MARILVIGDNERELTGIAASLAGLNHFVRSAWDADSVTEAVANGSPELVVMYIGQGPDSLARAKDLTASYEQVAEAPRLAAIESASDSLLQSKYITDFILTPYDDDELNTRIQRLLLKSSQQRSGKLLTGNGLEIDTESFEVTVDGRQLALTFKEFELLRYLAAHPGRVHTREALLNQVWGYEYFGGLRTVDVHVRRIRAKLGPKNQGLVQTVHGVGYKFVTSAEPAV